MCGSAAKGAGGHPEPPTGEPVTPVTGRSLKELHSAVGAWLCTCHRGWQHQGYPEGGGNITAAETSTMTFKEQLWLKEAGPPKYLLQAAQKQHTQEKVDTGCLLYS
ncbi:hypothetical protein Nmel_014206 [Mimus melanotis]